VLALGIAACGGNPAGPSDTTNPPAGSLTPGRYAVAVVMGTNGLPGLQPPCIILGPGAPVGAFPQPVATFFATAVSDGAGGLTLRPESQSDLGWTMTVRPSGSGFEGTMHGTARDTLFQETVTIDGGPGQGPATLTGAFGYINNFVGGQVAGRVVFERSGWTYTCPNNDWILNRMP
jgi:hypothetical protein